MADYSNHPGVNSSHFEAGQSSFVQPPNLADRTSRGISHRIRASNASGSTGHATHGSAHVSDESLQSPAESTRETPSSPTMLSQILRLRRERLLYNSEEDDGEDDGEPEYMVIDDHLPGAQNQLPERKGFVDGLVSGLRRLPRLLRNQQRQTLWRQPNHDTVLELPGFGEDSPVGYDPFGAHPPIPQPTSILHHPSTSPPIAANILTSIHYSDQRTETSQSPLRDPAYFDSDALDRGHHWSGSDEEGNRHLTHTPTDWPSHITNEILDLTDQVASVALFGSIGVGKSFLARTVLDHDRTKAKYGENRYFMNCDDLPNTLEGFIERLSDATRTDPTQLQSRLQSSPPLILLLDGVDFALDPLGPEGEEIYARIEEFGGYEHFCLVTTSRMYPNIHGFHRIGVEIPPEDGARDIFYSLSNLRRSPTVDALIAKLDSHLFSIELVARCVRENSWDEGMLLRAWDDQKSLLRTSYYQRLKDTIEPVFHSPMIKELGTMAQDVLRAIACFQSGIEEHKLEGIFRGRGGVRDAVDMLCKFSFIYRQDTALKMISPFKFYFLESMIVHAETEEVIEWGPECMPARAWLPIYTEGPPEDWFHPTTLDPTIRQNVDHAPLLPCPPVFTCGPPGSGSPHTTPHLKAPRQRKRTRTLAQILRMVKRGLLALFGRRIVPTTFPEIQGHLANIPPVTTQEEPTNTLATAAQEGFPNMPPATAQGGLPNMPPATTQEAFQNMSPTAAQEDLPNISFTAPQQLISPAQVPYEID